MTPLRRHSIAHLRRADPRRGKTLVELVVVMTVVATVLLLVGRVVVGLLRAEGRAAQTLLAGRTQDRVASRLRADVREATSAMVDEVVNGPAIVTLSPLDGSAIEYTVSAEGIERVVSRNGERIAQDTFRLPGRTGRFETIERGDATFLVLSVVPVDPHPGGRDADGRIANPPHGEDASWAVRPVWRTEVRLPTAERLPADEEATP